jgi:hypothetical protein
LDDLPGLALGEWSPAEAQRLWAHLRGCPTCQEAYAQMVEMAQALSWEPATLSSHQEEAVRRAKERLLRRTAWQGAWRAWARRLAPVAAGVVAGLVTVAVGGRLPAGLRPPPAAVLAGRRPGVGGALYVDVATRRATLKVWHLPSLPEGYVYEAWWTVGHEHRPAATFGVDARGDAVVTLTLPWRLPRGTMVGITRERAPGSAHPTTARLLLGRLRTAR